MLLICWMIQDHGQPIQAGIISQNQQRPQIVLPATVVIHGRNVDAGLNSVMQWHCVLVCRKH